MNLKPIRIISKNSDDDDENGGEEATLLSPSSRVFHVPDFNIYIVAIMGWKVPIEIDSIKAEFQRKLLKHPRFSSLQVMDELSHDGNGEIRWVPTTVNIDDHIILPQIAHNNMDTDKLVEQYISNLSTTTIDMSKPLWDFHVLNMKTSQAEATSIFRFHHSLGDGVALMSLLLSCFRTISDPTCLPTLPPSSKGKSNLSISNIWSLIWQYLVKLWVLINLLFNTVMDVLLIAATMLVLKDSQSPFTIAHKSNRQRFIYRTVSLDDIKFIKNTTNVTINDVILGITQAAFSRYIDRNYEVEGKGKMWLERRIRCRAAVAVNLRPSLGVQAIAEMIEKNATVIQGNCFSFAIMPLNISQLEDPLDYVRKAKMSMDRKKHSLETRCIFYILQLIFKFFGIRGVTTLGRVLSHTTLMFSNVAGPLEEVSLAGHPLAFLAPTCYGHPTGLMVHACSYAKQLTFVVAVDEGLIPDPNQLGDDFVDSFMLINEAAITKSRTKVD
ncbi:putative clustered mitochondria protein -like protein isoform X1 [Capsicum annuum]|uniref:wax ester synthase/diacylglycerol acyltransferase 11 n=1 Tax=Capsicum annuum TaxID=4072 RepID=UPI0007BEBE25|nr:wax ester synthase/diacylglycerol acyltransferase 11 [Capsicum annuum]KAF3631075.1 putative clustered mitochondria protein -like protein isoform X1 [Capsicum annuum]